MIAQHPKNPEQIAIVTFNKDIYSSTGWREKLDPDLKRRATKSLIKSQLQRHGKIVSIREVVKLKLKILAAPLAVSLILAGCGAAQDHEKMDHGNHEQQEQDHAQHQQKTENKQQVHVAWNFDSQPTAGQSQNLAIQVTDHSENPIKDFDINHEKKMHLIVVSEDLQHFDHLHPDFEGNGKFTVKTKFPWGGKYKLFADFIPKGGSEVTEPKWVDVKGSASHKPLQPDQNLVKTVDGLEVSLKFEPNLKTNQETMLTFTLKDAQTKKPVEKLEKYLGASGHVVIISEDAEQYLHVHPADEHSTGSNATFHTEFPKPGIYKVWGQFKYQGKVITVPFVVKVS